MKDMVGFTDLWIHTNGDGQILYPGKDMKPIPSIRLEIIRDGIEDYEYFVILEKLLKQVKMIDKYNTPGTKSFIANAEYLTQVPDEICRDGKDFSKEKHKLLNRRKEIADMIEQLNQILSDKDYESWKR